MPALTRKQKSAKPKWTRSERAALNPPRQISVSDWADGNMRLLQRYDSEPGPWRTDRAPYQRGIMDAFADPHVREIVLMSSPRVGKTLMMTNMAGYAIDEDYGPMVFCLPRDEDRRDRSKQMQNRIKASKNLSGHLHGETDELTLNTFIFDTMNVYFIAANSTAGLANRTLRYVFADEVDKYPALTGKEADPISLLRRRTGNYPFNYKLILVSSPSDETGLIWQEFQDAALKYYFHVPCPHCGHYQRLVWSQVKWPRDKNDKPLPDDAYYECEKCEAHWTDHDKVEAIRFGCWIPESAKIQRVKKTAPGEYTRRKSWPSPGNKHVTPVLKNVPPRSRKVAFHISELYSPWATWAKMATAWQRTREGVGLLKDFINGTLGEVWREKTEATTVETLMKRVGGYSEGVCVPDVKVLTAGVDVQSDHFYLSIRGWGFDEKSWLVYAARVESWQAVETLIFNTLYAQGDKTLSVRLALVDSGHKTDEVYNWCRARGEIARPIKGQDSQRIPYYAAKLDRSPKTGKAPPYSFLLWHLDTHFYKDKLWRLIHAQPGAPGEWNLYREIHEEYMRQVCAEHKISKVNKKTGRTQAIWIPRTAGAANHFLDCEVYNVAAADMLQVRFMREETAAPRVHRRPAQSGRRNWVGGDKGFLGNRKDWL